MTNPTPEQALNEIDELISTQLRALDAALMLVRHSEVNLQRAGLILETAINKTEEKCSDPT